MIRQTFWLSQFFWMNAAISFDVATLTGREVLKKVSTTSYALILMNIKPA
jgi:hypothetical protein